MLGEIMATYLDTYCQRSTNRFFNSVDTLVQRAKLINQPYRGGHIGLPRNEFCPAFLAHTGLFFIHAGYIAQGFVNLGLSILSPTQFPNTFIGLALDVGSLILKLATVALAVISTFTRLLAFCFNYSTVEDHSELFYESDCDDAILEELVANFHGANDDQEIFSL
jgi:hypothetical protein